MGEFESMESESSVGKTGRERDGDGTGWIQLCRTKKKANKQHGIKTELKQVLYVKCTSVS